MLGGWGAGGRCESTSAAMAAASTPAPPGAATTMPWVGRSAGVSTTTSPSAAPLGIRIEPVLASAETPPALSADAVPYSAAPRRPSSSTARVVTLIGTDWSLPAPTSRAITSTSARGLVRGPARPTIAGANGVPAAIGARPVARRARFKVSRDSRGASETKKSLQEYASASAGDNARFRSGWAQTNLWPSTVTVRRHR